MFSRSSRSAVRAARIRLRSIQAAESRLPLRPISTSPSQLSPRPSYVNQQVWVDATESAHSILAPPPPYSNPTEDDPIAIVSAEIDKLRESICRLLGSSHPSLDTAAKYYFQADGKHIRPLLVLLMSQATNGLGGDGWAVARLEAGKRNVDEALNGEAGVLNDWNPDMIGTEPQEGTLAFGEPFRIPVPKPKYPPPKPPHFPFLSSTPSAPEILPSQRRLASVTEMIHVASLLHDDVIDTSPLRRGEPSAPSSFGSKLSILSGDFLLGRASVSMSRLGSPEVVELLATVIANLVEGEVMQLRATREPETIPTTKGFEAYMRKTYLKTASLMAKSARGAVILGGCGKGVGKEGEWVRDVAYGYGRNLGIAFQLIDDALDYLPSTSLGKPSSGADLRLGLATAPALFAWQTNPALGPLILRKFSKEGDVEAAREMVQQSDGLERTIELAKRFSNEARGLIEKLPGSAAREKLVELCGKVVERVK